MGKHFIDPRRLNVTFIFCICIFNLFIDLRVRHALHTGIYIDPRHLVEHTNLPDHFELLDHEEEFVQLSTTATDANNKANRFHAVFLPDSSLALPPLLPPPKVV
jgi:hypothetical protein